MVRKFIIILIVFGSLYGMYLFGTRNASVTLTESLEVKKESTYRNATFYMSDVPVTLKEGVAEVQTELGGEALASVRFLGKEVFHDIDGDGVEDVVFLVTQDAGGSETFYYVVGALKRGKGYVGTQAIYLGDRIAVQSTTSGERGIVVINYMDRAQGEPMTESPSVSKSMKLLFDIERNMFDEVVQNFEGDE